MSSYTIAVILTIGVMAFGTGAGLWAAIERVADDLISFGFMDGLHFED